MALRIPNTNTKITEYVLPSYYEAWIALPNMTFAAALAHVKVYLNNLIGIVQLGKHVR